MLDLIKSLLAEYGLAVGETAVSAIVALVQAEGDLRIAQAAWQLAKSTEMGQAEIDKREGTVQALTLGRNLRQEDLTRILPLASEDAKSGLVATVLGQAVDIAVSLVGD